MAMGDGGHDEVDGAESPALTGTPSGGWTVVGPDGRVRTFSSRDDVLASLAASNEVTAVPPEVAIGPRRLSLLPEEDPPPLPSKARRRSKPADELPTSEPPAVAAPTASTESTASTAPVAPTDTGAISDPPPSLGEPIAEPTDSSDVLAVTSQPSSSTAESLHSVDMLPADSTDPLEESGPTSSDLQPEPSAHPPPVVLSTRPKAPPPKELPNREDPNEGELVSLRDLVVVQAAGSEPIISTRSSSVPPPPKAGALRTLPPPARSLAPAPPPPTITVASSPPPPVTPVEPKAADTRPSRAVTKASVPLPAPEAKRGWLMPVAVCAVLAAVVAYATRGPTTPSPVTPTATAESTGTPAPSGTAAATTAASSTTAAPVPSGTPAASASVGLAPAGSASAGGSPAATGSPGAASRPGMISEMDSQLALSEVLSRAGAARRGGDQARAKALYERALQLSGGNVEAHAGLAEVARAQGDLAAAKANYERALAASPSYAPALLGLADVQWDQGDHEGAQRHYRELLGSHASIPERAKERARGAPQATPSTAPAPETAPAPTAAPAQ